MRLARKRNLFMWDDDLTEQDMDIYSEDFDDEEAISSGMKPSEACFMRGFNSH